jgi:NodT family efflux transporter outer membrane factor (OMF) lipoprotein
VRAAIVAAASILLAACSVGPNYVRPTAPVPPAWKEIDGWKTAEPGDDTLRGAWWEVFGDSALNDLEARFDGANQTLASAEAQLRQSRALVDEARAAWYPTVTIGVSASRAQSRATGQKTVSNYAMPLSVSWEADVWGRIRRTVESSEAGAQATAADVASTRLSLQGELAADWFQMRTIDAERKLLDDSVADFQKSLDLTQNRYAAGVASRADVVQAQAQLESTRAQAIDLGVARAATEHAIAVLLGTPPSDLSIPATPLASTPPAIPAGVPSELLERRPDVAAAERRAAAANAQIGVAEAAWFPTVTLSAAGGFDGSDIAKWLVWPSRFFSVGPAVTETVYDGGLRAAGTAQARAAYEGAVADYRQAVLNGFEEVEDDLAALRILEDEAGVQDRAVDAARASVRFTTNQYEAGIASYLSVVVVQAAALADERAAVDIAGRRLTASVRLVEAVGGGWSAEEIGVRPAPPGEGPRA